MILSRVGEFCVCALCPVGVAVSIKAGCRSTRCTVPHVYPMCTPYVPPSTPLSGAGACTPSRCVPPWPEHAPVPPCTPPPKVYPPLGEGACQSTLNHG